ncbi:hypothetical protein E1B28_004517 [Marasmius oreades]|uniref:Peroxisomal biogenesis factor 11 n=1 Tax=Marasmius oreades TaxID=181124 RepID=A0A9P8AD26_9AGAR|nr:uncharacterized protein E1B28_004517 [Marasmius oreades]KAG7097139.1 hypothetical protein E1B28_004517 [Marasmius oreades]
MNPLSSHPPRTPRTSTVSNGNSLHGTSIYETQERKEEDDDDDEHNEEIEQEQTSATRIRREEVWREMVKTSDGRDKTFKLIQYSIRVYLLFHTTAAASRFLRAYTRRPFMQELVKRLTSTMSGLSFSRKTLLLFNWLSPLMTIVAQRHSVPFSSGNPLLPTSKKQEQTVSLLQSILYAPPPVLLGLVNAIADDLYALSLLGILGKKSGERASRFADRCWWLATVVGLVENSVERQVVGNLYHEVESRLYKDSMSGVTEKSKSTASRLEEKELTRLQIRDYWLQISRAKLIMDLVFSSYDVFRIQKFKEPVQTFTGLAAAVLSSAKLYERHKGTLLKKQGQ